MRIAVDASDVEVELTGGARALCPLCRSPVMAKCGEIVEDHWAHVSLAECDSWSEGESAWHRGWKDRFPKDWRERTVGPHRADVRATNGFVVELQSSSIDPAAIRDREDFYGRMCWVFDASEAFNAGRLAFERGEFKWSHCRRSVEACRKPVLLCLGDGRLLELGPRGTRWSELPQEEKDRRIGYGIFTGPGDDWPSSGRARVLSARAFVAGVHAQAFTEVPIFGVA